GQEWPAEVGTICEVVVAGVVESAGDDADGTASYAHALRQSERRLSLRGRTSFRGAKGDSQTASAATDQGFHPRPSHSAAARRSMRSSDGSTWKFSSNASYASSISKPV